MKPHVLAAALLILPLPATAQQDEGGSSLMKRGLELFFQGLQEEMQPALRELDLLLEEFEPALRDFAAEMGPSLRQLLSEVEDWSVYEPPEMLPNGDIIIRRKPDPDPEEIEL